MSRRKFGAVKCLLHFDFPYFNEPDDGLGDEAGLETWSKAGNLYLAGTEIPKTHTRAPKFSYRCGYFSDAGSRLKCTNNTGIWNLSSGGDYELEAFIKVNAGGDIFALDDIGVLLSVDDDGIFTISWPCESPVTQSAAEGMTLSDGYHHILLRISHGIQKLFADGAEIISSRLPSDSVFREAAGFTIGGFAGYMDEFVFRHSAGTGAPAVPAQPYAGKLSAGAVGGFGTGSDGDAVISANTVINSYGMIASVTDAKTFSVKSWTNGSYVPTPGSEVMIHITGRKNTSIYSGYYASNNPSGAAEVNASEKAGLYAFGRIAGIDGVKVELRHYVDGEFTLDSELVSAYYVQVLTVPNFASLTVKAGKSIKPLTWAAAKGGGIVAFRCKGDCTINGSILTMGYGRTREDLYQMTNSRLLDRFLFAKGGGTFITCGGTLTAGASARIGASWSGLGDGKSGAAGYGGNGSSFTTLANSKEQTEIAGSKGGVGGGGGGHSGTLSGNNYALTFGRDFTLTKRGGAAGSAGGNSGSYTGGGAGCGGGGGGISGGAGGGGGQGGSGGLKGKSYTADSSLDYMVSGENQNGSINGGKAGDRVVFAGNTRTKFTEYYGGSGGGGAGGNGGGFYSEIANAGACVIAICNKCRINAANISTGGSAGTGQNGGGGGTGFCYIACREQE